MRRIGRSEFELLKNANIDEGNLPRGYLSPSSIGKMQNCGQQFKRYYIDGEDGGPPSPKMLLGTDVHQMVEDFCTLYFQKCDEAALLPEEISVKTRKYVWPSLEEIIDFSPQGEEPQNIFELWYKEMTESLYVPLQSESTFYCASGETPIMCKVDLILLDLATNTRSVIDLKIGAKKRDPAESTQLHLYSAATGIQSIGYWQMVPPKVRVGAKSILTIKEVDNSFLSHVERTVNEVARSIQAEIFIPAQPGDWMCSPKYCGHFNPCRGGEK